MATLDRGAVLHIVRARKGEPDPNASRVSCDAHELGAGGCSQVSKLGGEVESVPRSGSSRAMLTVR